MKIFKNKHKLQKEILSNKNISFVPTMGIKAWQDIPYDVPLQ